MRDKWKNLYFTKSEGEEVKRLLYNYGLDVMHYTQNQATEGHLKKYGNRNVNSPEVLHIATHGFSYINPSMQKDKSSAQSVFEISLDPMFRSGILFDGSNYAWQYGRAADGENEDDILTAYDVNQLDLRNTQLVVLSACETILGDIHNFEGVYGLQRAFKMAGGKYLIMSLWQVPNMQTKVFMTTFYTHWLEHNMTILETFRKTQLEMKELFDDPLLWAGFVLLE